MTVSEAKKRANNKWVNANYKRVNLALNKEEYAEIEAYCNKHELSKNSFFKQAAKEKLEREK